MVTVLLSLSDAYTWISHVKIQFALSLQQCYFGLCVTKLTIIFKRKGQAGSTAPLEGTMHLFTCSITPHPTGG